jgi:hypothetical protein
MRIYALLQFLCIAKAAAETSIFSLNSLQNDGLCCVSTITVQVQPIYYSQVFISPTKVDPFNNGETVTVVEYPFTLTTSSIIRATTTGVLPATCAAFIVGERASSVGSVAIPRFSGSTGAPQSPSPSRISSTTLATTAISVATSGPSQFFVALNPLPGARNFRLGKRIKRQLAAAPTASPIIAVDLISDLDPEINVVPLSSCNKATQLILNGDSLFRAGTTDAVAKLPDSKVAVFGSLINPAADAVNTTFSIDMTGVLTWQTSNGHDTASFFACSDGVYAVLPNYSAKGCVQVQLRVLPLEECNKHMADLIGIAGIMPSASAYSVPSTLTTVSTTTSTIRSASLQVSEAPANPEMNSVMSYNDGTSTSMFSGAATSNVFAAALQNDYSTSALSSTSSSSLNATHPSDNSPSTSTAVLMGVPAASSNSIASSSTSKSSGSAITTPSVITTTTPALSTTASSTTLTTATTTTTTTSSSSASSSPS